MIYIHKGIVYSKEHLLSVLSYFAEGIVENFIKVTVNDNNFRFDFYGHAKSLIESRDYKIFTEDQFLNHFAKVFEFDLAKVLHN